MVQRPTNTTTLARDPNLDTAAQLLQAGPRCSEAVLGGRTCHVYRGIPSYIVRCTLHLQFFNANAFVFHVFAQVYGLYWN